MEQYIQQYRDIVAHCQTTRYRVQECDLGKRTATVRLEFTSGDPGCLIIPPRFPYFGMHDDNADYVASEEDLDRPLKCRIQMEYVHLVLTYLGVSEVGYEQITPSATYASTGDEHWQLIVQHLTDRAFERSPKFGRLCTIHASIPFYD